MPRTKKSSPKPKKSEIKNSSKVSIIRFIYLYIITAITFIVFIIGAVSVINVVLKEFVFEIDEGYYRKPHAICETHMRTRDDGSIDSGAYEKCLERQEKIESDRKQRAISESAARTLSIAIAQILVGFPLWIFHWKIIERDRKDYKKSGRTTR